MPAPPAGAPLCMAALIDCCWFWMFCSSFFEIADARLDLVDGVVHGLNLAGDLVDLVVLRVLLLQHLLLQIVHVGRHLVDRIGALLDEILHDAHALVIGLLETGDGILQLLDLRLQLDHVPVGGKCRRGKQHCAPEDGDGGETDRFAGKRKSAALVGHGRIGSAFWDAVSPRALECARADG